MVCMEGVEEWSGLRTLPPRALGFINEGRTDLRTLGALEHIYSWSLRTPPLRVGNYL
jgi:hypothetical protein